MLGAAGVVVVLPAELLPVFVEPPVQLELPVEVLPLLLVVPLLLLEEEEVALSVTVTS